MRVEGLGNTRAKLSITNNTLSGNTTGIRVNPSSNVVIDGGSISNGTTGVQFVGGDNNTVKNVTITNHVDGVVIDGNGQLDEAATHAHRAAH